MKTSPFEQRAANTPDFAPVVILFESPRISGLFLDLLQSRDIPSQVIDSCSELAADTRIITEPQYFEELLPAQRQRCLLVGQPGQLPGHTVATLSQPLTEDKIERAIQDLLAL